MNQILSKVDHQIKKYQSDHHGDSPLYILVSSHEFENLLQEIKSINNYAQDVIITTYKESKVIKYDAFQKGELLLTNELPESSS